MRACNCIPFCHGGPITLGNISQYGKLGISVPLGTPSKSTPDGKSAS